LNVRTRIERLEREARRRELESQPPKPILYRIFYEGGELASEVLIKKPPCNCVAGMMKSWKQ